MVLTDHEIQIIIELGLITVDPAPIDKAYSSTTVDFTLDEISVSFWRASPDARRLSTPTIQILITNEFCQK